MGREEASRGANAVKARRELSGPSPPKTALPWDGGKSNRCKEGRSLGPRGAQAWLCVPFTLWDKCDILKIQ